MRCHSHLRNPHLLYLYMSSGATMCRRRNSGIFPLLLISKCQCTTNKRLSARSPVKLLPLFLSVLCHAHRLLALLVIIQSSVFTLLLCSINRHSRTLQWLRTLGILPLIVCPNECLLRTHHGDHDIITCISTMRECPVNNQDTLNCIRLVAHESSRV